MGKPISADFVTCWALSIACTSEPRVSNYILEVEGRPGLVAALRNMSKLGGQIYVFEEDIRPLVYLIEDGLKDGWVTEIDRIKVSTNAGPVEHILLMSIPDDGTWLRDPTLDNEIIAMMKKIIE
jgi:hypothetical protein